MKNQALKSQVPLKGAFTFIDIETTGLRANKDRINKINLIRMTNGVFKESWSQEISTSRAKKIKAPYFADIQPQLHAYLKDTIVVAHPADFVYNFIKAEMSRCKHTMRAKTLCSLSLSRFLFPDCKEHDLQTINHRIGNKVKDEKNLTLLLNFFRHLEKMITPDDLQKKINELTHSSSESLVLDYLGIMPNTRGIYRCYNQNNAIIYIGKSNSLSKSIASHFQLTQESHKELQIHKQIKKVDWLQTYGELGTAFLWAAEIRNHQPIFNRLVAKNPALFTIKVLQNGEYLALSIANLSHLTCQDFTSTYGIFKKESDATQLLKFFMNETDLCYKINSLQKGLHTCFRFNVNKCKGACGKLESPNEYNARVTKLLKTFVRNKWPFKEKIAIQEICPKTNRCHYHIIDRWIYLTTIDSLNNIPERRAEKTTLDVTIYKNLHKFLNISDNHKNVIELASSI